MEKSAIISVRSFSDLNKDEVIEVVTPGKFHLGESEFKAVYEESEISGMDGTTTNSGNGRIAGLQSASIPFLCACFSL